MDRRDLLLSIGAGASSLAGCTGDGGTAAQDTKTETTTPTATEVDTPTPEPADLQIDQLRVEPSEVEMDSSVLIEVEVSNYGEKPGGGEVWISIYEDPTSMTALTDFSIVVDVEGGETETYSESIVFDYISDFVIKTDPSRTTEVRNTDHSADLKINPKEIEIQESFKNYEGYTITGESVEFRETYKEKSMYSGDVETVEPENEDQFAFVSIAVENDGSGSGTVPLPKNFFSVAESELYELAINPLMSRPDFRGDLEGISLYDTGEIPPGTAKTGYLVFEVPRTAREEYALGWSSRYSPDQVVYWR